MQKKRERERERDEKQREKNITGDLKREKGEIKKD
jgi:hypothetical protein